MVLLFLAMAWVCSKMFFRRFYEPYPLYYESLNPGCYDRDVPRWRSLYGDLLVIPPLYADYADIAAEGHRGVGQKSGSVGGSLFGASRLGRNSSVHDGRST